MQKKVLAPVNKYVTVWKTKPLRFERFYVGLESICMREILKTGKILANKFKLENGSFTTSARF